MAFDVFISHSQKDKKVADAICAMLEAAKVRCWIAPRDIPPGSVFETAIVNGLGACRIMVLIFSSSANLSDHVLREVQQAFKKHLIVVPFRIENIQANPALDYYLSSVHWLDALTEPMKAHVENLVRQVKGHLGVVDSITPLVNKEPSQPTEPKTIKLKLPDLNVQPQPPKPLTKNGTSRIQLEDIHVSGNMEPSTKKKTIKLRFEAKKPTVIEESAEVKKLRKEAERGDVWAQNNLGVCYYKGAGVTKDLAEAVKWYRKAADQGLEVAQYNLGVCYDNGAGVTKDETEAIKWYHKAADQGNKWYRKADDSVRDAQYNLGACYERGTGVTKDLTEAVKWYRKAADQGHAYAQNSLGLCYFSGTGVPKDDTEAIKWFRKAAAQGEAYALSNLGECYEKGVGVAKSKLEAIKWYRKAADQGHEEAKSKLEELTK